MTLGAERGWLPDLIYTGGVFQSGVAIFSHENGRIRRLSSAPEDLRKAQRLVGKALLPGLVNGHSHAFQRVLRGRTEHRTSTGRDSFWTWREAMYRAANRLTPENLYHVSRMAFLEMARAGITTVGEFHYLHHAPGGQPYADRNELALQVIRAARDVGIRIVLLRTAYVRSGWNKPAEPAQTRFLTPSIEEFIIDTEALRAAADPTADGMAWVGVAPHSLRAVPLDYLRQVAGYARSRGLPVHMHVSEQPADVEACVAEYNLRPVELLDREGLLDLGFTAVHAIHVTDGEILPLGRAGGTVCACPTTERNLGDGTVPADRLLRAGAAVSLGSDSNVQIDLLEDARSLEYHLRIARLERAVLDAKQLFSSATEAGAASLFLKGGKIEAGQAADFFTVALDDVSLAGSDAPSLLANVVFSAGRSAVRDVVVGGKYVIRDGRHARGEEIIQEFARLQKELWL